MEVRVQLADLCDPAHAEALVEILDAYAREPNGQSAPLTDSAKASLIEGLKEHATSFVLFAFVAGESMPVGAAVCFWGYSTFAGKPLVNLHDFAVLPSHRGRGIGRAVLAELERRARARGCAKITLEVHDTNEGAKRLYEAEGFGPFDSPTLFVSKPL